MMSIRRLLLACGMLVLPALGYAQEAVLTGTITDATGAVLPGVTVTAVLEATGNTFVGTTDGRGIYRLPVRVGAYRITAELPDFITIARTGVSVLVGQTVAVDLQMALGGLSETTTVTAEAPLINTKTSTLGGNVDPRQVAELPVNGRNFMALALLAPGSRTETMNASQPLPDRGRSEDVREFQINLDGQQVTRDLGTGDQPKYSQDMIAEFQYIANRFDATMGRSSGVLVNIITKSGTNDLSGVFRGNFRNNRFSAQHPVFDRVVPIDNQQFSTGIGGPIVRNKLHFFGNFEYEREPTTSIWSTPYPSFNVELKGKGNQKKGGVRLDYQLSPQMSLMGKGSKTTTWEPFGDGNQDHPAGTSTNGDYNTELFARLTHVLSTRAVNEVQGGRAVYGLHQEALTTWSKHWQAANGVTNGSPRIRFRDFNITQNRNLPRHQDQWYWSLRDNLTYSYDARGRHDLKIGGEFLWRHQIQANRRNSSGEIDARGGPTPANIEVLFPNPFDVDTWNLAAISPLTRSYIIGVGNFDNHVYSQKLGAWAQDDWQLSERVTLNLGMRYDVAIGAFAQINFGPWEKPDKYDDWNNVQPRVGLAYKLNDQTVLRGGVGLYVADAGSGDETQAKGNAQISIIRYTYDGRADFAANPTNGRPLPTFDEAQGQFCHANNNAPGCVLLDADELLAPPRYEQLGRAWQTSIGLQHQVGSTIGLEADYVYTRGSNEKGIIDNANVTYDPATGANYSFTDRSRRAFPNWGRISMSVHTGRSASHEVRSSFTKRFGDRWQASGNYSLRWFWDAEPLPFSGIAPVPFATAPDLGGEWSLAAGDQRHRAVLNGIWQVGGGVQVSALQYIGSGTRLATNYGGDLRNLGADGTSRLRADGSIVPRNSLVGPAHNRTDLRVQKNLRLPGRASIDAIVEAFNLFNRPNWQIGAQENRSDYLQHIDGEYRTMQIGFRLTF